MEYAKIFYVSVIWYPLFNNLQFASICSHASIIYDYFVLKCFYCCFSFYISERTKIFSSRTLGLVHEPILHWFYHSCIIDNCWLGSPTDTINISRHKSYMTMRSSSSLLMTASSFQFLKPEIKVILTPTSLTYHPQTVRKSCDSNMKQQEDFKSL